MVCRPVLNPLSHTSQGLKSPLKGKRFQTIDKIQVNTMGQLMAMGGIYMRLLGAYFEGDGGIIVLCIMFLVSCIFFSQSLFFILNGSILSEQTSYVHLYIHTHTHRHTQMLDTNFANIGTDFSSTSGKEIAVIFVSPK